MEDERKGLPSASAIERITLCPASWKASKGLELARSKSLELSAETGDIIHSWLAAPGLFDLEDPDDMDVADSCIEIREAAKDSALSMADLPADTKPSWEGTETRLWIHDADFEEIASSKIDYGCIWRTKEKSVGFLCDYKTNRGDIASSPENMQLRTGAIAMSQAYSPDEIYTCIIQPHISKDAKLCRYDRETISKSFRQLLTITNAAEAANISPGSKDYKPGIRQCKYCPAKLSCEALKAEVKVAAAAVTGEVAPSTLSGEGLANLIQLGKLASGLLETAEAEARKRLTLDPDSVPGYMLRYSDGSKCVTNPVTAFERIRSELGGDVASKTIRFSLTKAYSESAKAAKLKPVEAKRKVDTLLGDIMSKKPKSPSLVERKGS